MAACATSNGAAHSVTYIWQTKRGPRPAYNKAVVVQVGNYSFTITTGDVLHVEDGDASFTYEGTSVSSTDAWGSPPVAMTQRVGHALSGKILWMWQVTLSGGGYVRALPFSGRRNSFVNIWVAIPAPLSSSVSGLCATSCSVVPSLPYTACDGDDTCLPVKARDTRFSSSLISVCAHYRALHDECGRRLVRLRSGVAAAHPRGWVVVWHTVMTTGCVTLFFKPGDAGAGDILWHTCTRKHAAGRVHSASRTRGGVWHVGIQRASQPEVAQEPGYCQQSNQPALVDHPRLHEYG